ncbi:MAG: DUF2207 domain-containing protein [Acidobacteriota bacterium]|jgi:uncharacterized membrane protein YgcG
MQRSLAGIVLLAVWLLVTPRAEADERILRYHSDIDIAADATMVVEETIEVRAEGTAIRRGIYRDFPTEYQDAFGNAFVVEFEVVSVRRDGAREDWHAERRSNGVRVYAGSANRQLEPGVHEYTIRYRTDRQLGFFENHDELYWNVTGNGWAFPIDEASALVRLPGYVAPDELSVEAYTGFMGDRGGDYAVTFEPDGPMIRTNRPLGPREGLTIVVGFPKGLVAEPTLVDRLIWLVEDNRGLLLALVALVGSVVWLVLSWQRVGRDPEAGVVFAQYEPPEGYSPASARYIRRMGYDAATFSAAVVNLAVKGHLVITKRGDDYELERTESTAPLAPGEAALLEQLFRQSKHLELDNRNHAIVNAARRAHKRALRRDYLNRYFRENTGLLLPSLFGSLLLFVAILMLGAITPMVVVLFVVNGIVHALFAWLLKAPTARGRALLDRLEGFRLYLDVAEKDDLNLRHPPEKTPELFERYLPFAMALGVEQAWAEQFTSAFARIQAEQGVAYRPGWYHGDFNSARLHSFASDVGSGFTSAISSAASPPGSSSGGGGGGSSGGGGGGGGGGGW